MANIKFQLKDGFLIEGTCHKDIEMRELTAGDVIASVENATQVFITPSGEAVLLAPDVKVIIEGILRVVKLTTTEIPFSRILLEKLSATDFDVMMRKYLELRGARRDEMATAGRD